MIFPRIFYGFPGWRLFGHDSTKLPDFFGSDPSLNWNWYAGHDRTKTVFITLETSRVQSDFSTQKL